LVFNTDCKPDTRESIDQVLTVAGLEVGLCFKAEGSYRLTPNPETETFDIEFLQS